MIPSEVFFLSRKKSIVHTIRASLNLNARVVKSSTYYFEYYYYSFDDRGGSGPNSTPSYYSVQFHVYRLLIAPSIIDNLIKYLIIVLLALKKKRFFSEIIIFFIILPL